MTLCIDCYWFKNEPHDIPHCWNPTICPREDDVLYPVPCAHARSTTTLCGDEAVQFTPKVDA